MKENEWRYMVLRVFIVIIQHILAPTEATTVKLREALEDCDVAREEAMK